MKKIGGSVLEIAEELMGPNALREYEAFVLWPEIAGAKIASAAKAERVSAGILYVKVSSAVWRQELSLLKPRILEKYRVRFGREIIRDIVFR